MRSALALLCVAALVPGGTLKTKPHVDYRAFEKKLTKDRQIVHALNRLTFGPRPGDVEAVKKLGLKRWIDWQLHPDRIAENPDLDRHLRTIPAGAFAPERRIPPAQYAQEKLYRAIYSNRQLQEVMVDFWYNHFNVDMTKGADSMLVPAYERDAIRPHVLGKFGELLGATASSPAMLFYLDNWQSVAPNSLAQRFLKGKQAPRGLNENYARELMELHTLGVDGGYTQKDVTEVARCFTGWTIDRPNQSGPFLFRPAMHDNGEKTVLGVTIPPNGGREDGEKVLDILARHPSTARFISTKLAIRFVADDPPPALIEGMAKTFEETDGDIRAVLATMFGSKEFFSEGAYRAKVKTPLEMVVGAVRATAAEVSATNALFNQIASLGEPLYRKIEPTGYSSMNAEWVNSAALLGRMNFGMQLAQNRVPGVRVEASRFSADPVKAARQILFTDPAPETLRAISDAAKQSGPQRAGAMLAGLVLGSPDFQRR